tara:strand:+ start:95 stop:358 length:264 start_codon:yes stop_codon:yes gene_type:complete
MKFTNATAITPADGTAIVVDSTHGTSNDAVFIGVGGDASFILAGDTAAVVFKNMISGTLYPLSVKCVQATATAATDIVVLDSGDRHV